MSTVPLLQQHNVGESSQRAQVSFARSQLILFQSRKKFGLLYSLATVAGLFCIPGVLGAMGAETGAWSSYATQVIPLPLISLFIATGMYILNDLVDADLDRANGKKRPIPSGLVSKRQAWGFILLTNAAAVALSVVTLNQASMLLVGPMLAIGIMYSAPKIALMNRFVIKNAAIAAFYMMCVLLGMTSSYGAGIVADNPMIAVHAMSTFGVMIFVGSIVNDLGDVKGDKAEGRRTIPIVMGGEKTVRLLMALLLAMCALSWMMYGLLDGASLSTSVAISIITVLALLRMTKMQKGLSTMDAEYMRRQHKKWFPLHMVMQSSFVIAALLL
jgi:4-hydroxybenzoate polyprenyltransferase